MESRSLKIGGKIRGDLSSWCWWKVAVKGKDPTDMDRFKVPSVPPKPVSRGEKFDRNVLQYDPRRLIRKEELGRGSFGIVWKGVYGGKEVVIKDL